jgi:hypothetical protein
VRAERVIYRNPLILANLGKPQPLMIPVNAVNRLGLDRAMAAHIAAHWHELFFVKARDWEQEREFRWLVPGTDNDDFFVDIRNSLVGIALGDLFPPSLRPAVAHYASTNPVSVAVMNWRFPQPASMHWRQLLEPGATPQFGPPFGT